uniref:DALR anticodon binding domain-containing protein n=1 Tax=Scylla olivacea TaxID=85551 RepID=A0A0P4W1W5_SCYOL
METSVASFVSSFLGCVMGEPPTQHQTEVFMAVARRADFEKLTQGDFVIPLNSPKLKSVADAATPFGKLLLNPTEENIKLVEQALETCRPPVGKIVVLNNMLRIHLVRVQVMKTFLPRIAKAGLRYGACKLLQQVPITVTHRTLDTSSSLRNMRGAKLANHLSSLLAFCGAEVNRREKQNRSGKGTSKDFMKGDDEHCEPQTTPVTEAHHPEQTLVEASMGNKRQSDKGHVKYRQGSEVREKKPHIEILRSHTREDDSVNAAPDTTEAEMHVVCTLQTQNILETQPQCVREEIEASVTGEGIPAQESSHTQDASEEKDEVVSEVEFVVTDSMKRVKDGPWVYQYGGVVEVRTGGAWAGSVQEYCRILVEELKRTSEMRQRDMDGPEWVALLEKQAGRCLTLQLLSPTHSNPLRVEVEGDTHNTKEASFMLYNYARLCSIFDHFEQCVQQGDVAPLPPVEDVDFSLLRNDEEWDLVWLYLLRWPEIVEEVAMGVAGGSRRPKTAHISRFLYSLSHRWSEYYCRHQVLSEGFLPHLLPLMYARLHLLQALSTLMRTCFAVLGVDSLPSYM